ncbi:HAMP domain-containing histidine kinase [Niabella hibiscisoli]|nr:HAMP domain-containing sensor histidine kinase [Niabella hibiscisoli]MCH5719190.1 HAMP domain-containing histidine kinase [Niabella hibiscisoli]
MFELYADLISFHMQLLDENTASSNLLLEEKQNAEFREQFIAVLGHDMRNPLGAISNVAALLMRMQSDEKVMRLAGILQNTSFRMKGLIDNIMDFSQARLGGGILLNTGDALIEELIQQVVSELKLIYPDQIFQVEMNNTIRVHLDGLRLAQLSSNLISNAITHGAAGEPILIKGQLLDNFFELSIINSGQPISEAAQKRLFQPFSAEIIKPESRKALGWVCLSARK